MSRPNRSSNSTPGDFPTDRRQTQDPSLPVDQRHSSASTPASSPHGNDSEGYPSWLPKRPPPPAPASTLHSSTANMFTADAGPSDVPPVFSGGRKPTPRSVRIVSLQDSARREPTDQTRVSNAFPAPIQSRVWSRATGAGVSPTLFSQTLGNLSGVPRPKFRAQGLHLELLRDPSWKSRLHFYVFPLLVLYHLPLQTFFDFNAVFILIEIAKFPNPVAPGVPGSGHNWALAAAAYVACWVVWVFGVFIAWELIYSFYRRWRFRRPLMLPLYLSSPAFNFVSMTSYTNFCVMQHIRNSAFPHVNPNAALPSAEGSIRDALAETCYFYAQNLPTVATLLPRAGIALTVLLSFYSPEQLPGGVPLGDVDQSLSNRDGTFFDQTTGTLSGYAKGVLIANAAWTAWRAMVLLLSWLGLWIFSGYGCAGVCGPRTRWDEEDAERTLSVYSEKESDGAGETLPWSWKECTHLRVQEAYDFCLTLRPPRPAKKETSEAVPGEAFEGIDQVLAAVGLGGGAPTPARRGMLSEDLFESPQEDNTRKSSPVAASEHAEKPEEEGPNMQPYPFPGFGPKKSDSDLEQIPFPPSPGLPDEDAEETPEDEEVDDDDDDDEYEEVEEEEAEPRTSGEPSSFSGRASNSLSSLGQPVPSRYPFHFRHPGRGGSMSSTNSPGAISHITPQSKSTSTHTHSTRNSKSTRSTGNGESSDSPMSMGSSSAASPPGMPMPPRHPTSGAQRRQRAGTVPMPSSPTPAVGAPIGFAYTRARRRTESGTDMEPSILYESDGEGVVGPLALETASRTGGTTPDPEGSQEGSQEALEREDHVGLLSAGPSPTGSSTALRNRNGSAVSLSRLSNGSRSRTTSIYNRSRSRHGSAASGSRSGSNSRHNSHHSMSSISVALGAGDAIRSRAQSLIHSVGSASRSSIEIVLGGRVRAQSAVRLEDYDEGAESSSSPYMSEDAMSNPENYTFGQPVVGGAGMGRRAARALHSEDENGSGSGGARSASSGSPPPPPPQLHASPSTVSQATPSERSVSTQHAPVSMLAAPASPSVPIPPRNVASPAGTQFLSLGENSSHPDISTAAASFVTAPATIEGQTESSGATPSSYGGLEHYMQSAAREFRPV
ncbi:hypothetical protein BV25DRAFT_1836476 [Artomyces pyxidatus]|uniref:Uncharacterized protein n=1 Tax=Artomyces pyxidatus TaxID=48021 RepID=A0ACB8T8K8_9AGAM|nr:hypothetical protein BV25DRAFT_1836476 [Artomyces pyxidatus]